MEVSGWMDPVVVAAHIMTCIIGFALYGLMALGSALMHADERAKKAVEPSLLSPACGGGAFRQAHTS